ncbi:hypothetical protein X975_11243, partial [Stegodyphus mimosarum]
MTSIYMLRLTDKINFKLSLHTRNYKLKQLADSLNLKLGLNY